MAGQKETRVGGFLKQIAGRFVEFQEDANSIPSQPNFQPLNIQIPRPSENTDSIERTGELDDDLFKKLGKVLEESNLPGPDYIELTNGAETIGDGKNGDDTRYIRAFKFIKSMYPNFSKEIVINSIDEYLRILDAEKANAMDELQSMWNSQVDAPENELKKTCEEIESLEARLNTLKESAAKLSAEIESAKVNIQDKRSKFENTFTAFRSALANDKDKLTNIL